MLTKLLNSQKDSKQQNSETLPSEDLIKMTAAKASLRQFIKQAWHIVEPKTIFKSGWHLDAICDHLHAVTDLEIQNLLINIPPRHMKSLAVSVFFPAWEWITYPEFRYVFSSYAESLSKRDSVKCRRLIQSLWYQSRWGGKYQLTSDQNEKLRFENDQTGMRLATSVDGLGTGEGGDRIIADDPHNVKDGESPVKRGSVIDWWDETMSTRLNDEDTGAKIIIMQRVHQNDLSGHVIAENHGYTHLCLPARYEGKNRIFSPVLDKSLYKSIYGVKNSKLNKSKPWVDRRKKVGESLWKTKFGKKQLDKREQKMSQYAIAGQHQQNPAPRGGGLFKVEHIKVESSFNRYHIVSSCRYWDKAGTKEKEKTQAGCFTSGVLMHKMKDNSTVIEHMRRGKWEAPERETVMKQQANIDGIKIRIYHEQEGGSGGKESAQATNRNLSGYRVEADHPTGHKEVRAEAFASQVGNGFVTLIDSGWQGSTINEFLEELEMFPYGTYADQVDCSSGAFNKLNAVKPRAGTW